MWGCCERWINDGTRCYWPGKAGISTVERHPPLFISQDESRVAPEWCAKRWGAIEQHRRGAFLRSERRLSYYTLRSASTLSHCPVQEWARDGRPLLVWSLGQLRSDKRDGDCVLPHGDEWRRWRTMTCAMGLPSREAHCYLIVSASATSELAV